MPGTRHFVSGFVALLLVVASARTASAVPGCPFCGPCAPPFSERLADSDTAVLCTWESLISDENKGTETTTFAVVMTVKKGLRPFKKGEKVVIDLGRNGKKGDVFLILGGDKDGEFVWDQSPIEITSEYVYRYIVNVPSPETPDRLSFFLKYLESSEPQISQDAYAEFSKAQFKDVAALAPKMPKAELREWLESDAKDIQVRRGMYGMMLGLSGDDEDARFLEELVLKAPDPDKPRFGYDGMMAGYVMLRGAPALQKLVETKFSDPAADGDLPLLTNAIVFLWDYCPDRIPAEDLKAAMRRMLDRPKWSFGVVEHLARWKDWKSLDKLIDSYGKAPFDSDYGKQKVVEFALVCEKAAQKSPSSQIEESAAKAHKFLSTLDAQIIDRAKRGMGSLPRPVSAAAKDAK